MPVLDAGRCGQCSVRASEQLDGPDRQSIHSREQPEVLFTDRQ